MPDKSGNYSYTHAAPLERETGLTFSYRHIAPLERKTKPINLSRKLIDFQRLGSVDLLHKERRSPFPTKYKPFYVPRREQRSLFPTHPWVLLGYCWVSRFPVHPNQRAAKYQHALATCLIISYRSSGIVCSYDKSPNYDLGLNVLSTDKFYCYTISLECIPEIQPFVIHGLQDGRFFWMCKCNGDKLPIIGVEIL